MHQYLEKYSNKKDESLVDKAVDQFKKDQEKRDEELFLFLDDFVQSKEYKQYMRHKRRIKKRNVAVQYSLSDLNVQEELIEDKYPLTTKSRKMLTFIKHFERYTKNKENAEIVKRQEKGINIIKQKIQEYKDLYLSTKDKIYETKEYRNEKILEEFCEALNIDISTVRLTRKKIRDCVVCYQNIKHSQKMKIRSNIMDIVKKLTEEYKRKKQIEKTLNKTYLYKVERRERIIKDMEIVGHKIILQPRVKLKDKITKIIEESIPEQIEEAEPIIENEKTGKDKGKKSEKMIDEKEKGKPKKQKEPKPKKEKPAKKDKKTKQKDVNLVIPPIPKCNLRSKLGGENYDNLLELLTHFENLENQMEDQHILAQKGFDGKDADQTNKNFIFIPDVIEFKHFRPGISYKKKLRITNRSLIIQKIRLMEIIFPDPYEALLFKVLPLFGVIKLAAGCFLDLTVIFSPKEGVGQIEGKVVFVCYNKDTMKCDKFSVALHCIPPFHDLKIEPKHVQFGKIPIWRAYGTSIKCIKLINRGNKAFEAIIKKVTHQLEPTINSPVIEEKSIRLSSDNFIVSLLEECLENVFSNFQFEHYFIQMKGMEEQKLSIKFRNARHIGSYFEKYCLHIHEPSVKNGISFGGCQEITASAETTEYFLKIVPNIIDFGVCILNSIYQTQFEIHNDSSITQAINLKFPSNMTEYIKTDIINLYVRPQGRRSVSLKFLPRKTLFDFNYYDTETSILEFPVYFHISSKTYYDMPPIKATVFAILTAQNCLAISPTKKEVDSSELIQLNLGYCSIYETLTADIELVNNSLAPQIYGFMNIPPCVMISPNYGFGEIKPNEKKILKLHFSPDYNDILDKFEIEGSDLENVTSFRIKVETVSSLGQCKKEFNKKRFGKVAEIMIKELKQQGNLNLIHDMEICVYYVKINLFSKDSNEEGSCDDTSAKYIKYDNYINKKEEEKLCITQLWVNVKIVNPLLEFSHQYVEFPETPCGSYSVMQVELRASNNDYLFKKFRRQVDYKATFRISGGNDQISIEPTCGALRKGEVKKIFLIVKPTTPDDIIKGTAKDLKYSELYEQKKEEYELQNRPGSEHKKDKKIKKEEIKTIKNPKEDKKGKKGKNEPKKENDEGKGSGKGSKAEDSSEKELKVDYLDLYPAQMYYWRNLEPYTIKATFTCNIYYDIDNMIRKPETLYLKAACRVVKPDFISNLKLQRIDFGKVAIGTKATKPVIIQNIHYNFIKPEFSILNPVGPFSIPYMKDVRIPPEHFLEIPLYFKPEAEGHVEEYFEITSGKTNLSLILEGTSIPSEVDIFPRFLVCRLQTHMDGIALCPIEIKNGTESDITISIQKVFELEGTIREVEKNAEIIGKSELTIGTKDKSSKSEKQSDRSKKSKEKDKIGEQKFSDVLSEAEQASFPSFAKKRGHFCYGIINLEGNKINVEPFSSATIKIGFGLPENLLERKQEEIRKINEKLKGKSYTKIGPEKGSKKDKDGGKLKHVPEDQKYHVTKYNVFLNKTFLRDFILISSFIE